MSNTDTEHNSVLRSLKDMERRLTIFVQSTTPLTEVDREAMSIMDVVEMLDIAKVEMKDQLFPFTATMRSGKKVRAGGFRKYNKDKRFYKFWSELEGCIEEMICKTFSSTKVFPTIKKSVTSLPAIRFCEFIIKPLMNTLKFYHPENVMVNLDALFLYLKHLSVNATIDTSPMSVKFSRRLILNSIIK